MSMHVEWHFDTKTGFIDMSAVGAYTGVQVCLCKKKWSVLILLIVTKCISHKHNFCWLSVIASILFPQGTTMNNSLPQLTEDCLIVFIIRHTYIALTRGDVSYIGGPEKLLKWAPTNTKLIKLWNYCKGQKSHKAEKHGSLGVLLITIVEFIFL